MTDAHGSGHGNTVAAWTAVSIMMIGTLVSGVSVWYASATGFWVGIGIVVLGAIVGKVLQVMGYGQSRGASTDAAASSTAQTAA
jgi:hypothetical protein